MGEQYYLRRCKWAHLLCYARSYTFRGRTSRLGIGNLPSQGLVSCVWFGYSTILIFSVRRRWFLAQLDLLSLGAKDVGRTGRAGLATRESRVHSTRRSDLGKDECNVSPSFVTCVTSASPSRRSNQRRVSSLSCVRLIARVSSVPAFLAAPTHPTRDLFLVYGSVIQQSLIFSVRETFNGTRFFIAYIRWGLAASFYHL